MHRIRSNRRRLGLALGIVLVLIALAAPGSAGAVPGRMGVPYVSGGTGACASWWHEGVEEFFSVSVCGADGVIFYDGEPVQLAEPVVWVARYACSTRHHECIEEQHGGVVERKHLTVDPLLRTAAIQTVLDGCVVDVRFAAISGTRPEGGLWEAHGLGGMPTFSVGGRQTVTRDADSWGDVCGQKLFGGTGGGQLWQGAGLGIGGYADGAEVASGTCGSSWPTAPWSTRGAWRRGCPSPAVS